MADPRPEPLSPEQAKARLREAADNVGVGAWVRRHPYDAVMIAVIAGLLLGGVPALREASGQVLRRLLLPGVSRRAP
ncbi:MAG: hypothetical protein GWO02_07445 [Gammaproteobacteria bacterium]|nr:hypothetical protein [Gammaproteobacteria bacterium]